MVISLVDISKKAESPTMHQQPVLAACFEKNAKHILPSSGENGDIYIYTMGSNP